MYDYQRVSFLASTEPLTSSQECEKHLAKALQSSECCEDARGPCGHKLPNISIPNIHTCHNQWAVGCSILYSKVLHCREACQIASSSQAKLHGAIWPEFRKTQQICLRRLTRTCLRNGNVLSSKKTRLRSRRLSKDSGLQNPPSTK